MVVGAGVAGLGTALALSRAGHRVTLVERDATPLPPDPDAAFAWDRRGAPQVRHSHAMLARLRNLLRDRYPDVLEDLLAAGATEMRFTDNLPEEITDRDPRPGDEDLVALACRRTTFEWVLRRSVLATDAVTLRHGLVVDGLVAEPTTLTDPGLSDAASEAIPRWSAPGCGRWTPPTARPRWWPPTWSWPPAGPTLGRAPLAGRARRRAGRSEEDTGIIYLSRFYRLLDGADLTPHRRPHRR